MQFCSGHELHLLVEADATVDYTPAGLKKKFKIINRNLKFTNLI